MHKRPKTKDHIRSWFIGRPRKMYYNNNYYNHIHIMAMLQKNHKRKKRKRN